MSITAAQLVASIGVDASGLDRGVAAAKAKLAEVGSTTAEVSTKASAAWGSLAASVSGFAGKAVASLAHVSDKLTQIADGAGQAGQQLSIAVTLPIAGIIQQGLAFDDLKNRALIGFTSMTGSAQVAKKTIDDLQGFAVATPFDFSGLLKDAQLLAAMGTQAKDILPDIQAIGDAVAKSGGSGVEVDHAALALSQMGASAHLTAQDMNQLVEGAHIPAWDMLGKAMGKTTAQVREMSEKGLIPGKYAAQALFYEMEKGSSGAMTKIGGTLMAATSNLKDAAIQSLGAIFEPLYKSAASVANRVAGVLMQIKGYIEALPASTKKQIGDMLLAVAAVGPALLAVSVLARAFALLSSPMGIAAAALAYGTYYLLQHKKAAQELAQWIQDHWGAIWQTATAAMVLFTGVGVVRTLAALTPLVTGVWGVVRAAASAFLWLAGAIAAAMGLAVGPVVIALAVIAAVMAAGYFAWRNNWLGFRDVVDTVVINMEQQIDGFLDLLSRLPGAVGQAATAAKVGLDTIMSLPGSASGNLASMFSPKGLLDGLLPKAPDISALMKQITSIKMPSLKVPALQMPKFQAAADDSAQKKAEKAAQKLADLYANQVAELDKQMFLLGKTGKLAETQANIRYGDLGKLNRREQAILLTLAAQYDARKRQQDVVDALRKSSDDLFVSGLSKQMQAIVQAAGGYREWLKIVQQGNDAQNQFVGDFLRMTRTADATKFSDTLRGLGNDITALSFAGRGAAQSLGVEAAGGMEEYRKAANMAYNATETFAQALTRAASQKAWDEGAVGKIKDLQEQVWDTSSAFHTASDSLAHFFDNMKRDTGTAAVTPTMKLMQTLAEAAAKTLDMNAANQQIETWQTDLSAQIETAKAKIAGTYDPARAAVAAWAAQNKDALEKLAAEGGNAAGILANVALVNSLNAQADAAEKMRDMVKSARQELLGITNPFAAWKESLGEMPGVSEAALKNLYAYQQNVEMVKDAAAGMRDAIVGGFNDAFEHGAKSFFGSVLQGWNKMVRDMAVQQLTNRAMGALTGLLGGVLGGGAAGGSIAGNILSSGGGINFAGLSPSLPSIQTPDVFPVLGARALGGPVQSDGAYLVGERGPEMIVPRGTGTVLSHDRTDAALSGQRSTITLTVVVQSSGGNAAVDKRSGQQAGQAAIEELQRYQRRNGG